MPPPYHNCSIGSTDDNLNIFLSLFLSVTVGQYRSILCLRETFTITNLQYYSIGNMHSVCVTHSNTKIKNFDSNFEGSPGCHTHRVWQRSRLVSLSLAGFFLFSFFKVWCTYQSVPSAGRPFSCGFCCGRFQQHLQGSKAETNRSIQFKWLTAASSYTCVYTFFFFLIAQWIIRRFSAMVL